MKVKVLIIITSIFSLVLALMNAPPLVAMLGFPIIYFVTNLFPRHEIPNVLRIFLASSGGTLVGNTPHFLSSFNTAIVITFFGLVLVALAIELNDEPIRHIFHNRGVIVIAGFDGSGKTTQARWLYTRIRNEGLPCSLIPFSTQTFVHSLSRAKASIRGEETNPKQRGQLSIIRPYIALFENYLQYLLQVVPKVWHDEFVICDRFIWQAYIKHKSLGYKTRFMFFLSTLVKPECLITFNAPFDILATRIKQRGYHPPYDAAIYELEKAEYRKIAKRLGANIVHINGKTSRQLHRQIAEIFANHSKKFREEVYYA